MHRAVAAVALAVAALALLAPAPSSWAEEPPAPAAPAPADAEPAEAVHSQYDVRLAAEGLPAGWKVVPSGEAAADEAALRDAILGAVAGEHGKRIHLLGRSVLSPEGKKAVLCLVDLDAALPAVVAALDRAAAEKGWAVGALGHSTRRVVVAGPEEVRGAALDAQKTFAARMLGVKATSAMTGGNGERAFAFARAALAIDGKHAAGHYVAGVLLTGEGLQLKAREADDADPLLQRGVAHLRAALGKDASGPLSAGERAAAGGELGLALLHLHADAEARDVLKAAVAGTFDDLRHGIIARYNLACAHGRLKELDDAFAHLERSLKEAKERGVRILSTWRDDADFANLKGDPRWAALEQAFPDADGGGDDGDDA